MAQDSHLLTDAQIQRFILDGYITVQTDAIPETHGTIYDEIETVFDKEGNVGNNILPRVPRIQKVFDQPVVRGALTSLLGPDYIMNPHRHCHLNPPGSGGQSWHKDCYVFDHNIRHPRFQWVLAFYYPQDTTIDMGPSGVIPRMQNYKTISDPNPDETREPGYAICGDAGIVTLMHFDSWHRATPNVSNNKRYMLKFQFTRMRSPCAPNWNHQEQAWTPPGDDANPAASQDVWRWLQGRGANGRADANGDVKEAGLFDEDECVRINTAYALASDRASIPVLVDAMRRETLAAIEETTATTADNAHGTNPTPGAAARALSTMGTPAVPALLEVLEDDHWWIRAMAADVLARTGPGRSRSGIRPSREGRRRSLVGASQCARSVARYRSGFRGHPAGGVPVGKGSRLPGTAQRGPVALQPRRGGRPGGGRPRRRPAGREPLQPVLRGAGLEAHRYAQGPGGVAGRAVYCKVVCDNNGGRPLLMCFR